MSRNRKKTKPNNIYRDRRIHVVSEECSTCVFRPGSKMHLEPGRLKDMIQGALKNDSCIVCHSTLGKSHQSVCRGFYDRHRTLPLIMADVMELVTFTPPQKLND